MYYEHFELRLRLAYDSEGMSFKKRTFEFTLCVNGDIDHFEIRKSSFGHVKRLSPRSRKENFKK